MAIVSEAVANAEAEIARLGPDIEEWTNTFVELLDNVTNLDLVFREADKLDLNYIALCPWNDPSNLVIVRAIPQLQTAEERKRTLATTSILTALLHRLGYLDVAVALLADDVGKAFRHEGFVGHCRSIGGCSRVPTIESKFDFSSISGHIARGTFPA
jgi:hypothetical protein